MSHGNSEGSNSRFRKSAGNFVSRYYIIIISLIIIAIITVSGIYLAAAIITEDVPMSNAQAVSSWVLSGALVVAYIMQIEVLRNQLELMEENHIPRLELDRVRILEFGRSWSPQFEFRISNAGKGISTNLQLNTRFELVEDSDLDFDFLEHTEELSRHSNAENPESEGKGDYKLISKKGAFLRPDESGIDLYAGADIHYSIDGDKRKMNFEEFPREFCSKYFDDFLDDVEDFDDTTMDSTVYEFIDGMSSMPIPMDSEKKNQIEKLVEVDQIEESTIFSEPVPTTESIMERCNQRLDFRYIRVIADIQYEYAHSNKSDSVEVMDRVIPIQYGVSIGTLFTAGLSYEEFTSDNSTPIEVRLARDLAKDDDLKISSGH